MKGIRYEKHIDLELYRQMVDMIFRLSGKEDKIHTKLQIENTSLFWEKPRKTMEEAYGLHYPGEVLERLGEKTELTLPKIRALSLALGQTKDIHEEGMYIGTQFSKFYQKTFRTLGHTDCYLLAAKYLLDEKNKRHAYQELLKCTWENIEEVLFALSVMPDDDLLWEQVKEHLNYSLGKQRVLDVYEDGELFIWISRHCSAWLKGYRKKDLDALKYITRLPNEPARIGNIMQKKLMELGYTLPEIHFLNGIFIKESGIGNDSNSITAERIAVEVCKFFLNADDVYPEIVYELCGELIDTYKKFSIKLEGAGGILQYLKDDIQLKNVKSYQWLFSYKKNIYREYEDEVIFYIDLTDIRWDSLYTWLEKEKFDWLITRTICGKGYTDEELRQFLYRYEALTGEKYECIFWKQPRDVVWDGAFFRLSEAGILIPVVLMEEYVNQLEKNMEKAKEKWKYMFEYLLQYMEGIGSPEAFQMLTLYMEGRERLETPDVLPSKELIFKSFGIKDNWCVRERFEKLNILRLFLTPKEHHELFLWLDATIFKNLPDGYVCFLVAMLEDSDTLLWMTEEEAREICFRIFPMVEDYYTQKRLQKRYLTKEEYERQEREEEEQKRRKKMLEEIKIYQRLKHEFTKMIARKIAKGQFQAVYDFLEKNRYPLRNKAEKIVAGYLSFICGKERSLNISQEELIRLLKLEMDLLEEKLIDMETLTKTILKYEEEKNA